MMARTSPADLAAPLCQAGLDERTHVVKVEELDARKLGHRGVDVTRHGHVDNQQGSSVAGVDDGCQVAPVDDGRRRTRRREQHVDVGQGGADPVELHGAATDARCQRHGALPGAVGDEDLGAVDACHRQRHALPDLTGTQQQDALAFERAQSPSGHVDRGVGE